MSTANDQCNEEWLHMLEGFRDYEQGLKMDQGVGECYEAYKVGFEEGEQVDQGRTNFHSSGNYSDSNLDSRRQFVAFLT